MTYSFDPMMTALDRTNRYELIGRVNRVVGLVIESNGPTAKLGDVCLIDCIGQDKPVPCEVVGFKEDRLLLMPLGDIEGIAAGNSVKTYGQCLKVPAGQSLLGRVVNALGDPIDDGDPLYADYLVPSQAPPPRALSRKMIDTAFSTGVRAIDSTLTVGVGQRVGIFAGSGVGKSTLLGMIARNGTADINVIALVGERGREVKEFIKNDLGEEGLQKSVIVCATSDEPALIRIKAAFTATAIAEHFRDQGQNVLLMMDSVTRFCMAQREIGLAVGEPPSTKGYTPSVFALLPKLMERTGCSEKGAITALYTVLVEGDDTNEPIADAARSILDGHVILSRNLTSKGHYPPIDVMNSLSRTMPMVTDDNHVNQANKLRELIAAYNDIEELVSVGAYKSGSKPIADLALDRWPRIQAFLRQNKMDATSLQDSKLALEALVNE